MITPEDANVRAAQELLGERARIGLAKYGCTTERSDLTHLDWLKHARSEALDLAVYLTRLIRDEESERDRKNDSIIKAIAARINAAQCNGKTEALEALQELHQFINAI